MFPRTVTESLPVKLTDEERLNISKELGNLEHDIQIKEVERTEAAKAAKLVISSLKIRRADLCNQLRTGEQYRQVDVMLELIDGMVVMTRGDTGEMVGKRSLLPSERQAELPVDDRVEHCREVVKNARKTKE